MLRGKLLREVFDEKELRDPFLAALLRLHLRLPYPADPIPNEVTSLRSFNNQERMPTGNEAMRLSLRRGIPLLDNRSNNRNNLPPPPPHLLVLSFRLYHITKPIISNNNLHHRMQIQHQVQEVKKKKRGKRRCYRERFTFYCLFAKVCEVVERSQTFHRALV